MLTRRQLQRFSVKKGVALHNVERDYVQTLFLYELYTHNTDFLFKGGTCLRMVFKLNRYSEDLDFNFNGNPEIIKKNLVKTTARLIDFGIEGELKSESFSSSGVNLKLRYKGPLYNGKDLSRGTIRIDVSCRKEKVETTVELLNPIYDDCPSFVFTCLTLDHILAEKIRALVIRGKPRDLYDVWFLGESIEYDLNLINQKLKLYNMRFEDVNLDKTFANVEKDWKQDILPLLGFLPDFNKISSIVEKKFRQLKSKNH